MELVAAESSETPYASRARRSLTSWGTARTKPITVPSKPRMDVMLILNTFVVKI
jgi:hypothetical protein